MNIKACLTDTLYRVGTAIGTASITLYTKINCRGGVCHHFDPEVIRRNETLINPESCLSACQRSFEVIGKIGQKLIFKGEISEDRFTSTYDKYDIFDKGYQPDLCRDLCSKAIQPLSIEDAQTVFSKHSLLIPCIAFVATVDAVFKHKMKNREWTRMALGTALAGAMSIPTGIGVLDCIAAYWCYRIVQGGINHFVRK
jgi:hypothetical protein